MYLSQSNFSSLELIIWFVPSLEFGGPVADLYCRLRTGSDIFHPTLRAILPQAGNTLSPFVIGTRWELRVYNQLYGAAHMVSPLVPKNARRLD